MVIAVNVDGENCLIDYSKAPEGPYKIFENVTNEISNMKYLVCLDHCDERNLVGAFNEYFDALIFATIKNQDRN